MIVTLFSLMLTLAPGAGEAGTTVCPADHADNRHLVERFLERPAYSRTRVGTGTQGLSGSDVRALTDSTDLPVCQRLVDLIEPKPGWTWSAYRVGDLYMVAYRRTVEDGVMRMEWRPFLILDRNYAVLRALAM